MLHAPSLDHDLLAGIWFAIEGLFLIFYVVLDGFDLGIGILSLFMRKDIRPQVMMSSISTVWDANESWLVVLGGTLFGAFPLVYALLLRALYIPAIAMLFGFIFRGVSFEYWELAHRKSVWLWAFGLGSAVVAVSQGYILGGLLDGMTVVHGHFRGGLFAWFTGFATLVALGVVIGYVLLGATYLIMKTENKVQAVLFPVAKGAAIALFIIAALITLLTPLRYEWAARRWLTVPGLFEFGLLPLVASLSFWRLFRALRRHRPYAPFAWTLGIFLSSFLGLGVTIYPYIVPDTYTVYAAATGSETLIFMLAVVGLFIPIMIAYNAYLYVTFRGKTGIGGY